MQAFGSLTENLHISNDLGRKEGSWQSVLLNSASSELLLNMASPYSSTSVSTTSMDKVTVDKGYLDALLRR